MAEADCPTCRITAESETATAVSAGVVAVVV
jgi:hypothetical protein